LVALLYLRTAGRVLGLWLLRGGRVDRQGRAAHEDRLERIAANAGLQMSTLTALQEMAPPPSSATVGGVLSVTALDVLLTLFVVVGLGVLVGPLVGATRLFGGLVGVVLAALAIRGILRRRGKRAIAEEMRGVAVDVGRLTDVPLVLMGHSHRGSIDTYDGVVYGNSGCWLDGSHLVVRRDPETRRPAAIELRRWRNGGVTILQREPIAAAKRSASSADVSGSVAGDGKFGAPA
jgi:hypothetical protein